MNNNVAQNTDIELWRTRAGDYYGNDSIHVTADGSIGINCHGTVYVMPIRAWHAMAALKHNHMSHPCGAVVRGMVCDNHVRGIGHCWRHRGLV